MTDSLKIHYNNPFNITKQLFRKSFALQQAKENIYFSDFLTKFHIYTNVMEEEINKNVLYKKIIDNKISPTKNKWI